MLEWLRKLMVGDQSAAPPQGKVDRDERGRIFRVTQTLSLTMGSAGSLRACPISTETTVVVCLFATLSRIT